MKNKKLYVLLLICISVLFLSACSSTQTYGSEGTYTPSTFETTMVDAGAAGGGSPGVLTVAWNVIKWPVHFIFGIPKATLNLFDGLFNSADQAGVGQVQVTEGY